MSAGRRHPIVWVAVVAVFGFAAWFLLHDRSAAVISEAERATGLTSDRPPAPLAEPELAGSGSRPSGAAGKTTEDSADPDSAWRPPELATHVDFVDASTGTRLHDFKLGPPDAEPGRMWTVVPRAVAVRILERGFEKAYWIELNRRGVLGPDGYVVVQRPIEGTTLATHAKSYRAVQPVYREQTVRVTFLDGAGQSTRGGRIVAWRVGDFAVNAPEIETDAGGSVRLRGVPSVPGALLRLQCEREVPGEAIELPPTPEEVEAVRASFESPFQWPIPTSPDIAIDAHVAIASLADPTLFDRFETDNDRLAREPRPDGPEPDVGSVRVELQGRDGQPIPWASVAVGGNDRMTGKDGSAAFDRVESGHQAVTVREPGRLFQPATAYVAPNAETRLKMIEILGATLEIVVVDSDGDPAPFAVLSIRPSSGPTWVDVDDAGEQRLDPFTDARGRRTCARIAPGIVTVTARHGDGNGKASADLGNGERRALRLELR